MTLHNLKTNGWKCNFILSRKSEKVASSTSFMDKAIIGIKLGCCIYCLFSCKFLLISVLALPFELCYSKCLYKGYLFLSHAVNEPNTILHMLKIMAHLTAPLCIFVHLRIIRTRSTKKLH